MTTTSYQASSTLNPHPNNIPATYTATDPHHHAQTVNYGSSPSAAPVTSTASTSRFNKAFFLSIPGILKLVSLVREECRRNSSAWFVLSLTGPLFHCICLRRNGLAMLRYTCISRCSRLPGDHHPSGADCPLRFSFERTINKYRCGIFGKCADRIESNDWFVLIGWRVSSQTRRTVLGSTFVHKHVPNIISSSQ